MCIRVLVVSYRNSTSNHNKLDTPLSITELYLIEILHQTTTVSRRKALPPGCILSKFYIKPQPLGLTSPASRVVSYRNSTSNHNLFGTNTLYNELYLIEILHQTTTFFLSSCSAQALYLIEILHQTTTVRTSTGKFQRCILSKFYIKPQLGPHID